MEATKEFERITEVITDFYERWSQEYRDYADAYVPTIVIYYWHEESLAYYRHEESLAEGFYLQHARPKLDKLTSSEIVSEIVSTFQSLVQQYRQNLTWDRVCKLIKDLTDSSSSGGDDPKLRYVKSRLNQECGEKYKRALDLINTLVNKNMRNCQNCTDLLPLLTDLLLLLNALPFWKFPLKPLVQRFSEEIREGSEDLLFKIMENGQPKKLRVWQHRIREGRVLPLQFQEWTSFQPDQPDPYFLLFNLLERSLLFRRADFIYAYIVPLNDEGFFGGNAALLKYADKWTDDEALLHRFIFDIKARLNPEIRMAMDFEVQSAIRRDAHTLIIGDPQNRKKVLKRALNFYYPLSVEVDQNGYLIRLEASGSPKTNVACRVDRELSKVEVVEKAGNPAVADGLKWLITRVGITFGQERKRVGASYRQTIASIIGRVNAHDHGHVLTNAKLPAKFSDEFFDHFKEYLRERMVFAAEASSTDPNWAMPLLFMSQLIVRFAYYLVDTTKEISPVCRHIAQSEGVDEITTEVICDGKQLQYSYDTEKGLWQSQPDDLYVSVPTGLVGTHALYCIFENVARNGAKYGKTGSRRLTLHIRLDTKQSPELIRIRIWTITARMILPSLPRSVSSSPPHVVPRGLGYHRRISGTSSMAPGR